MAPKKGMNSKGKEVSNFAKYDRAKILIYEAKLHFKKVIEVNKFLFLKEEWTLFWGLMPNLKKFLRLLQH